MIYNFSITPVLTAMNDIKNEKIELIGNFQYSKEELDKTIVSIISGLPLPEIVLRNVDGRYYPVKNEDILIGVYMFYNSQFNLGNAAVKLINDMIDNNVFDGSIETLPEDYIKEFKTYNLNLTIIQEATNNEMVEYSIVK